MFRQVLDLAAQEKFDCVELMCWPAAKAARRYAGITHLDVSEFSEADARRVRGRAESRGISISGLGY